MHSYLLNRKISEESVAPCYFFYGEETFLAYQFIDELKKELLSPDDQDFNVERFNLESQSWMEVIDLARTVPFFFSSKRIIVVEVSKGKGESLSSAEKKILKDYFFSSAAAPPRSILIVIFPDKLKKNSPLFSFFSSFPSSVVFKKELKALKEKPFLNWIDRKFELSGKVTTPEAKKRLAELTGNDLSYVNNEIEKIITFVDDKKVIELDDVNQVSGWVKSFIEWEITDNLVKRDFKECLIVLDNLIRKEGTSAVVILGLVAKFFRDVLQAKLWLREKIKDRKEIFRELRPQIQEKFGSFYTKKFRQFFSLVDGLTLKDLNIILTELTEIDLKIKTSDISFQALLEGFLYRYCHIQK